MIIKKKNVVKKLCHISHQSGTLGVGGPVPPPDHMRVLHSSSSDFSAAGQPRVQPCRTRDVPLLQSCPEGDFLGTEGFSLEVEDDSPC